MSEGEIQAAIAALLTVGTLLLNLGVDMIQKGNIQHGILIIAVGVVLIFVAVLLIKILSVKIVEARMLG